MYRDEDVFRRHGRETLDAKCHRRRNARRVAQKWSVAESYG